MTYQKRCSTQPEPATVDLILCGAMIVVVLSIAAVTLLSVSACFDCIARHACLIR